MLRPLPGTKMPRSWHGVVRRVASFHSLYIYIYLYVSFFFKKKNKTISPLLGLKGIYHYWIVFFSQFLPGVLAKWKQGPEVVLFLATSLLQAFGAQTRPRMNASSHFRGAETPFQKPRNAVLLKSAHVHGPLRACSCFCHFFLGLDEASEK